MRYVWATGTHVGRIRNQNEDSVFPTNSGAGAGPVVVAVADGMGGHIGGEIASRVAIEAATEDDAPAGDRVEAANAAVVGRANREPELQGMGTTLTLAVVDGGVAHIGHVGDSRAYLFRGEELTRITADHTYVEWLRREGKLDEKDIAEHPMRHVVMRALGLEDDVDVDTFDQELEPGDRLLICSDGLSGMVDDQAIGVILAEESATEAAVWALIEAANAAGGHDNTTVALVDVEA